MKQILNRMALVLCTINLVPGESRAHAATGLQSGRPRDHRERGDVPG